MIHIIDKVSVIVKIYIILPHTDTERNHQKKKKHFKAMIGVIIIDFRPDLVADPV
jgi:hypothetical protein